MKNFFKDTAALIFGSAVFAAGLCIFASPCDILTGGAGGIGIIINKLFGIPVGRAIILVNLPLFTAAFFICGKRYTLKTVYSTVLFSAVIDIFEYLVPVRFSDDPLLSAVFGGILTGFGMYIVLARSLVTGGSDLLAYIIQRLRPGKSIDFLILVIDGVIVMLGAVLFKSFATALYSVLLIIMMTLVMGNQLRGRNQGAVFLIFSSSPQSIKNIITERLDRGYSVANVQGGHGGDTRELIICAVGLKESAVLRRLIFEADQNAFVIIGDAAAVCGNGFVTPTNEEIF